MTFYYSETLVKEYIKMAEDCVENIEDASILVLLEKAIKLAKDTARPVETRLNILKKALSLAKK